MRYVCLLRGINVGGRTRVAMADLRRWFEQQGFENVSTYINSGNVLFDGEEAPEVELAAVLEQMIEREAGFPVRVAVITAAALREALDRAPSWWGDAPQVRHNAIFVIPPAKVEDVIVEVDEMKPDRELVAHHGSVIFWSVPVAGWDAKRLLTVVGRGARNDITVRNANTTRRLAALTEER